MNNKASPGALYLIYYRASAASIPYYSTQYMKTRKKTQQEIVIEGTLFVVNFELCCIWRIKHWLRHLCMLFQPSSARVTQTGGRAVIAGKSQGKKGERRRLGEKMTRATFSALVLAASFAMASCDDVPEGKGGGRSDGKNKGGGPPEGGMGGGGAGKGGHGMALPEACSGDLVQVCSSASLVGDEAVLCLVENLASLTKPCLVGLSGSIRGHMQGGPSGRCDGGPIAMGGKGAAVGFAFAVFLAISLFFVRRIFVRCRSGSNKRCSAAGSAREIDIATVAADGTLGYPKDKMMYASACVPHPTSAASMQYLKHGDNGFLSDKERALGEA